MKPGVPLTLASVLAWLFALGAWACMVWILLKLYS